jgi:hypothetical protein
MKLYLGTHMPSWLWRETPPLCIARQRLEQRNLANLEPMEGAAMLDSGGFTELSKYGRWTWTAREYIELADELHTRLGGFDWIAPQDWMCEPFITAKTGKSVREHQELTVANGIELRSLAPHLPIRYVVQGYTVDEYLYCVDLYRSAGIDLAAEPLVGVGSVCRRQDTDEIHDVFRELYGAGLSMHGFGVKSAGFKKYGRYLTSADSLAWSFNARREQKPQLECLGRGHINCANCLRYAKRWYRERSAELTALAEVAV